MFPTFLFLTHVKFPNSLKMTPNPKQDVSNIQSITDISNFGFVVICKFTCELT